jgi:hypothetical protein
MAINILDITSIKTVDGDISNSTGTYDRMMIAFRAQLADAVDKNEITQSEAGTAIATGAIQLMSAAVSFELEKELKDAEINQVKRKTI